MGRNNVPYALLVILMIGVIICSTVADFSDAIRQRPRPKQPQPWLPTYHDVSDMNVCFRNCYKHYEKNEKGKMNCYDKCFELKQCVNFCEVFYKDNKKKLDSCKKGCRV
ncbi:hypothetical protein AAHE18_05G246700 [Arachis hypogaea]|nr:uncharacterized protein DS421_5g165160 [Arachis hypogaea]